jgi:microcompartment protein CcmL/EutN
MTVHKLCARITLPDGYSFLALVDDEQGAVQAGLEKHATSFTVSEVDVATPEDNVDWVFTQTSEDSERRYMGVDKLYNVDDMLTAWDKHPRTLRLPQGMGVSRAPQR